MSENDDNKFFDEMPELDDENDAVDATIKGLMELIRSGESHNAVLDPDAVGNILQAYPLIKAVTRGKAVAVECELNKPFRDTGYISVVGRSLAFAKTKEFVAAAKLASNLEIYPRTDRKFQINLTFNGITRMIDEGGYRE